ncbi:uncharacterized protein LOC133508979 [Syngnathoides biaculeatus]|uniref:uncharacterized protein LOC133508979 n=1 Tax=Syngnathoides biaculeatus TaxID=300417 RepID=UPI002ADE3BE3|nr:uncharacterized protein LOC133508979 [Syngnathoides biaculeatus]
MVFATPTPHLPQGFVLSPVLFNDCLCQFLSPFELIHGVVLVQYVDDLLPAAPSETSCLEATRSMLSHLASVGLKCSKSKIQIATTPGIMFQTLLNSLTHSDGWSMNKVCAIFLTVFVGPEADTSFISLKQHLSSAAALAIPNYSRMFYLDVSEKISSVSAALYQKGEGGSRHVCLYASTPLEKYERRHSICASFTSALARVIQKTSHIVLHHPLTVRISHSTVQYVMSPSFTMTGGRQRKIEAILTQPHILFTHEGVNMAEGLLGGEPHCCVQKTTGGNSLHTGLYETPLDNPDLILFTDGYCFKGNDGLESGFAVTQPTETGSEEEQAKRIPVSQSAQRAEIFAVTAALKLAKKSVN